VVFPASPHAKERHSRRCAAHTRCLLAPAPPGSAAPRGGRRRASCVLSYMTLFRRRRQHRPFTLFPSTRSIERLGSFGLLSSGCTCVSYVLSCIGLHTASMKAYERRGCLFFKRAQSLAYLFRYDVDARPSAVQLSHLSEVIESSRVGEEWVPGTRKLLLYLQLGELASSITRRRGGPRASSSSS
jgi:hypothetical protein